MDGVEKEGRMIVRLWVDKETALDWLNRFPYLPSRLEGDRLGRPSKAELRRWCRQGWVLVNGVKIGEMDLWPERLTGLVFWPGGKRQTTMWADA